MHNFLMSMVALSLLCSCRGCKDGDLDSSAGASPPKREQQPDQARLRARLTARNLDRNKSYPKSAGGLVACGKDPDCFLIQGEHCTPAVVTHTDKMAGYGLRQRVVARYQIVGNADGKCKLFRDTLSLDTSIDKVWADLLKRQGKTDEDIEQLRADTQETLREGNPERFECKLTPDQMLEAGLALAESLYDPQFWRLTCTEADLPVRNP